MKIELQPDQSQYAIASSGDLLSVDSSGPASLHSRKLLNNASLAELTWICDPSEYNYLAQCYSNWKETGRLFTVSLMLDSPTDLTDYLAQFVSFNLVSVKGETFTVKATLELKPPQNSSDDIIVDPGLADSRFKLSLGTFVVTGFAPVPNIVFAEALERGKFELTGFGSRMLTGIPFFHLGCGIFNLTGYDSTDNPQQLPIVPCASGPVWTASSLAAGESGIASTSPFIGAAYGNGIFIRIPVNSNKLYRSNDWGVSWSTITLPATRDWFVAKYGNGIWIVMCESGSTYITSHDEGLTWTLRTVPGSQTNWHGLDFGNNVFIAIARSGKNAYRTIDGITWTAQALPSNTAAPFYDYVAYGNGVWVVHPYVTDGTVARSVDNGITWTNGGTLPLVSGRIIFAGNLFYNFPASTLNFYTSPDGIVWTVRTRSSSSRVINIVYGNGIWIATYEFASTDILFSTDGLTFGNSINKFPINGGGNRIITYGGGVFISVEYGYGIHRGLCGNITPNILRT